MDGSTFLGSSSADQDMPRLRHCAFTPDEPCTCFEADWVLVDVALSVIFDEEVALTFV